MTLCPSFNKLPLELGMVPTTSLITDVCVLCSVELQVSALQKQLASADDATIQLLGTSASKWLSCADDDTSSKSLDQQPSDVQQHCTRTCQETSKQVSQSSDSSSNDSAEPT